jgi:hypothetical protein
MARTDIHRPSVIQPEEYTFVAHDYVWVGDLGAALFLKEQREILAAHMAKTGGRYSTHEHGGNCYVCGSVNAIYTSTFYHQASNSYIKVGTDCAEKMWNHDGSRFRKQVKAAIEAQAGKAKAQAVLADEGLSDCWAIYNAPNDWEQPGAQQRGIIADIVHKLIRYGSISDAQVGLLRRLVDQIANAGKIAAQRAAEAEAAKPLPQFAGRARIQGKVLTTKVVDSQYGSTIKMLVQHADGWKVWGTMPASLDSGCKGAVVAFDAAVQASPDDPKFGFFSRPTKAIVVQVAA